jgi:hypothetical protein
MRGRRGAPFRARSQAPGLPRPFRGDITRDEMARLEPFQRGVPGGTQRHLLRAPAAEPAPAREINRAGNLPAQLQSVSPPPMDRPRSGREERARVRMLRVSEDLGGGPVFNDLAEIHHRDTLADMANDAEVVADEQIGQAQPGLQISEKLQNLSAHRHVERRRRLVEDDKIGIGGDRARDADPLALAPAQLMGESIQV